MSEGRPEENGRARNRPFSDPEVARAAALKGVARRKELAALRAEDPTAYLLQRFAAERAGLADLLLDAAFGRRSFAGRVEAHGTCDRCGADVTVTVDVPGLPPDKRLTAVSKALEYAVGRPTTRKSALLEEGEEKLGPGLFIE